MGEIIIECAKRHVPALSEKQIEQWQNFGKKIDEAPTPDCKLKTKNTENKPEKQVKNKPEKLVENPLPKPEKQKTKAQEAKPKHSAVLPQKVKQPRDKYSDNIEYLLGELAKALFLDDPDELAVVLQQKAKKRGECYQFSS